MDRREQELLDKIRENTADVEVPEKLKPENIRQMLEAKDLAQKKARKFKPYSWKVCVSAAACVVFVIGLAVWGTGGRNMTSTRRQDTTEVKDAGGRNGEISDRKDIAYANSYDQVYGYIEAYQKAMNESVQKESYDIAIMDDEAISQESNSSSSAGEVGGIAIDSDMDMGTARSDTSTFSGEVAAEDAAIAEGAGDYSETNVRQEGVDEGDIVKTDGRYLYVLEDNGKEIAIVDTQGQDMEKVASIDVGDDSDIYEFYVMPKIKKLTLICSQIEKEEEKELEEVYPDYRGYNYRESVAAVTYDIQDPLHPDEEGRVSQSGSYSSSRVSDGCLYLFSEYYIWNAADQNEPRTFVPLIGEEPIAEKDIYLPPVSQANMYEVVTAVDLTKPGKTKDSKAIFSKGGQVYVSNANIYFYETEWGYSDSDVTTVRKIAYKDGKLEAKAQGKFNGYLNDSFSIDEYQGKLRVVTTEGDTNSVYILDEELEEIGSIEDLAKDERVYSARFMGDTGYFVTFRETDPLFSVDLSDPENPKIIGELKIPGFSDYLHFYGEDRLLGIGMNVDEETMITDGVKITMFDISDKADVKEADTYVLKNVYSTDVSYDYKAALVDPDRNIIGFPGYTEGGQKYYLFEYDEDNGFICNMEEEINGNSMRNPRGLYIEDTLYVVQGNIIEAYSLKDYKKVDDLIL